MFLRGALERQDRVPGPCSRTSRTPDNHRTAFVRSIINVSGRRRHLHFNSTGLDRGRRFFVVRVRLSRAGAQGLRWGIKATHNGCLWLITGHKASACLPAPPVDNKTPLKTNPTPGCRSGPVYCIVGSFNTRVQLLRTKQRLFRSAGMLAAVAEPLGSPPPTHLSNIPQKHARSFTSSPARSQIRLFWPQPLADIICLLPYLG